MKNKNWKTGPYLNKKLEKRMWITMVEEGKDSQKNKTARLWTTCLLILEIVSKII
jgi:hypothetical protein